MADLHSDAALVRARRDVNYLLTLRLYGTMEWENEIRNCVQQTYVTDCLARKCTVVVKHSAVLLCKIQPAI